ncbi:hypothetical protein, partial [Staphylococcus aureus]
MTDEELQQTSMSRDANETYYKWFLKFRDFIRQAQFKSYLDYKAFAKYLEFMLPININRIVETAKNQSHEGKKLQPDYVLS